jgi:hypothetical protein
MVLYVLSNLILYGLIAITWQNTEAPHCVIIPIFLLRPFCEVKVGHVSSPGVAATSTSSPTVKLVLLIIEN